MWVVSPVCLMSIYVDQDLGPQSGSRTHSAHLAVWFGWMWLRCSSADNLWCVEVFPTCIEGQGGSSNPPTSVCTVYWPLWLLYSGHVWPFCIPQWCLKQIQTNVLVVIHSWSINRRSKLTAEGLCYCLSISAAPESCVNKCFTQAGTGEKLVRKLEVILEMSGEERDIWPAGKGLFPMPSSTDGKMSSHLLLASRCRWH